MKNPKTTIAGYLVLGASVISFAAKILGGGLDAGAIQEVMTALGGIGLITAHDGSH